MQSASEQGDIWVLNLAHELSEELSDEKLLLSLYHSFLELKKNHCGGVVWTVEQKMCSMSPEVFLTQKGNILSTFPIKGTGDREYLEQNEKEISELAMVTDLLRNDLGQIAKKVWVENERVLVDRKSHWDAHSEIYARLPQNNISWEQFEMLLPAGSISGAPKKRVVEKILELENFDRDFYTGTFGVRFSPEESIFNILIRTLFAQDGKWRFPVGAGITYESDAVAEWQETLQKAEILRECTRTGKNFSSHLGFSLGLISGPKLLHAFFLPRLKKSCPFLNYTPQKMSGLLFLCHFLHFFFGFLPQYF
ncbi:chorismate-binding protein [Candidatus Gracilibacteria bacterium]|nr:chorismate-binding protein [Candidatus Gracilibacteria bacterium]MCF7819674.1 chorismate-binding protein [Candidatus Gracilibacteria bacterium]